MLVKHIIGCDVSKQTIDIYLDTTGRYLKIANNENGYIRMIKQISAECSDVSDIHICMEATGNYYEDFADYMVRYGYRVSVVNPLKIAYFAKSVFKRAKTDKADARLIADYCRKMKPEASYQIPTEQQYRIKRLVSYLRSLNQQQTALKNRLQSAKDTFVCQQIKDHLAYIKQQIKAVEQRINKLADDEVVQYLNSIPSIGKTTASILSYYLTAYRFKDAKQFTAFAGLSPQIARSGSSVKKPDKLSYLGNRTVKSILYMPAVVAYRLGIFKNLVDRLKAKGKLGKVIIVAIMRKLAVLAWTLANRRQFYKLEQ